MLRYTRLTHGLVSTTIAKKSIHFFNLILFLEELDSKYTIIEGPEDNVLDRYMRAITLYQPDFLVRITGDCVWIPPRVISKHIRDAAKHDADYCSNVLVRSFPEGYDCEVISLELMKWLDSNVFTDRDKEHVTTAVRHNLLHNEDFRDEFKIHSIINEMDLSSFKTSIDTRQEYDTALKNLESLKGKKSLAEKFGSVSA